MYYQASMLPISATAQGSGDAMFTITRYLVVTPNKKANTEILEQIHTDKTISSVSISGCIIRKVSLPICQTLAEVCESLVLSCLIRYNTVLDTSSYLANQGELE